MQYFQDTATGKEYAFEDSVIASKDSAGNYVFQYSESVSLVQKAMGNNTPTYEQVVTPLFLNLPTTLQPYTPAAPAADAALNQAKINQKILISRDFRAAAIAPVTDANGIVWNGGQDSGQAIFLACQLAQQMGAANVELYDLSNTGHSMTIAQGVAVAALIGSAFQTAYQRKQARKNSIDAVTDTTSTGITQVQAITW